MLGILDFNQFEDTEAAAFVAISSKHANKIKPTIIKFLFEFTIFCTKSRNMALFIKFVLNKNACPKDIILLI